MLLGLPKSAICVQRFDDSLNSAIRITYRISLRSSSLREPRYPLLRVVFFNVQVIKRATTLQLSKTITYKKSTSKKVVKIVYMVSPSNILLIMMEIKILKEIWPLSNKIQLLTNTFQCCRYTRKADCKNEFAIHINSLKLVPIHSNCKGRRENKFSIG